jgi:cyclopropane fatty-acyl-phospholipid synthase-like methyltransferase
MATAVKSSPQGNSANVASGVKIPISKRLRAWWDGNELSVRKKSKISEAAAPSDRRSLNDIELLQEIWGPGMHEPCSTESAERLLAPLGLNPAYTVLQLGAGLGAVGRIMVQKFGVWTLSLETDRKLVETGMAISEKAGMTKKAAVQLYNPNNHVYRRNVADCILLKETLHTIEDKDRMLRGIALNLKNRGQLLATDFVMTEHTSLESVSDWTNRLPYKAHLWTAKQYDKKLASLQFDVRINEDISETYVQLVKEAWLPFADRKRLQEYDPTTAANILQETERWAALSQAIADGKIEVRRFYAIKLSGTDEEED